MRDLDDLLAEAQALPARVASAYPAYGARHPTDYHPVLEAIATAPRALVGLGGQQRPLLITAQGQVIERPLPGDPDFLRIMHAYNDRVRYLGTRGFSQGFSQAMRGSRAFDEAFRQWFGDSQVVDRQGNPLVVYHGTDAEPFDAFDPQRFGLKEGGKIQGFYFASRAAVADDYRPDDPVLKPQHRARFQQLHADEQRLQRQLVQGWNAHYGTDYPLDTPEYKLKDADGEWVLFDDDLPPPVRQAKAAFERTRKAIHVYYADLDRLSGPTMWTRGKGGHRISAYLSLQHPLVIDTQGAAWTPDYEQRLLGHLRAEGVSLYDDYDGMILRNFYDSELGVRDTIYVAFRPEQIKAVDNRGTWDPTDPRMSFNR